GFFVDGRVLTVELPTDVPVDLAPRVQESNVEVLRLADVRSMLPDDDPRLDTWSEQLRLSLTTGIDDDTATELIGSVRDDLLAVRGAVVAPDPFQFTIGGNTARLPITITNTGDTPLDVVVRLE